MSTKLDAKTVQKIAKLAKLSENLSQEDIEKFQNQLGAILEYVDELQELDITDVSPLAAFRTIYIDQLRDDEPNQDTIQYQRVRSNIIANFPKKQGDLLVLPVQIIE